MTLKLQLKPAIYFQSLYLWGFLTDHNRSEIQVSYDEIGTSTRTVDGTLRGQVIARKRSFTINWTTVPSDAGATVDGFWGGHEMKSFYDNTFDAFIVRVYNRDKADKKWMDNNPDDTFYAKFDSFAYTIVNRNVRLNSTTLCDFWNVSMTFKEV